MDDRMPFEKGSASRAANGATFDADVALPTLLRVDDMEKIALLRVEDTEKIAKRYPLKIVT